MRFSIDTNVLVYSVDSADPRGHIARRIMSEAFVADGVLTNQVLGEFLNVVRIKAVISPDAGRLAVADWSLLFELLPTTAEHLLAASLLSESHRIQFWDAVILTVSNSANAVYLLSEDMQDGRDYDGVTVLNPFDPANAELLDLLLTPPPETA